VSLSKLLIQYMSRRLAYRAPREGDSLCTVGLVGATGKLVYRHTSPHFSHHIFGWCAPICWHRSHLDDASTPNTTIKARRPQGQR